jgi:sulfoxide reductase catalytic subunit YedY
MLITRAADIRRSDITNHKLYLSRRDFIRATAVTTAAMGASALATEAFVYAATPASHGRKLENVKKTLFGADEKPNKWEDITTYNNYYEFGIDKDSPSALARNLKTDPWTVAIDGECAKTGNMPLKDILKGETLEERIYRHRCVEAWSMVIPWIGFPLANLIKKLEPTSKAKYVEFTTFFDAKQMSHRTSAIRYPYVEGLRLDEAMHPLTIMAVGLYGEVIPNQDGAPMRLVVPWKYGFKHIKSIARIRFTEKQPLNTWQATASQEYGFYANVNPSVDHPRWSQSTERRIGEFRRRKTLPFNGYGDQVASMYTGMDLKRNF